MQLTQGYKLTSEEISALQTTRYILQRLDEAEYEIGDFNATNYLEDLYEVSEILNNIILEAGGQF